MRTFRSTTPLKSAEFLSLALGLMRPLNLLSAKHRVV